MNALLRKIGLLFGLLLALSMALPLNVVSADNGQIENPTSEEWDVKVAIKDGMLYRLYFDNDGSNFSATPLSYLRGFGLSAPAISPDGQWIAAVKCGMDDEGLLGIPCNVYKVASSGGVWEQLTFEGNIREVIWLNNGLWYSDSHHTIRHLGGDRFTYEGQHLIASPDGRLFAAMVGDGFFYIQCTDPNVCPYYDSLTKDFNPSINGIKTTHHYDLMAWHPNGQSLFFKDVNSDASNLPKGPNFWLNIWGLEEKKYWGDEIWSAFDPTSEDKIKAEIFAASTGNFNYGYWTPESGHFLGFSTSDERNAYSYPTWWKRIPAWQKLNIYEMLFQSKG